MGSYHFRRTIQKQVPASNMLNLGHMQRKRSKLRGTPLNP